MATLEDTTTSAPVLSDLNSTRPGLQDTPPPPYKQNEVRPFHILDLPVELIEKTLTYLSYEQISKVRQVCVRFNAVGSALLNSAFQRLQNNMLQRFQNIKSQMPRRESARRTHPLARECDIVETVHMRLTLLQMSFGKHIERKHCCFFAGEILDEVHRIFCYIKTTPNLARAYKVTDELFDLTTMAMEYFKEYIEPDLPEITYFATDFLEYNSFSAPGVKSCSWKNSSPAGSPVSNNSPGHIEEPQEMPSSNIVLKKKIKRLRQGMKRNNNRLTSLKRELQSCTNQLAEQKKQLLEFTSRFEDNDKKIEENSRKFSSLLQELNKCKTELQYWRSKSPATQLCCSCCAALNTIEDIKEKDITLNNAVLDDSRTPKINLQGHATCASGSLSTLTDPCDFVPIPRNEDSVEANSTIGDPRCSNFSPYVGSCSTTDRRETGNHDDKIASDNQKKQLNLPRKRNAAVSAEQITEPVVKHMKTVLKCIYQ